MTGLYLMADHQSRTRLYDPFLNIEEKLEALNNPKTAVQFLKAMLTPTSGYLREEQALSEEMAMIIAAVRECVLLQTTQQLQEREAEESQNRAAYEKQKADEAMRFQQAENAKLQQAQAEQKPESLLEQIEVKAALVITLTATIAALSTKLTTLQSQASVLQDNWQAQTATQANTIISTLQQQNVVVPPGVVLEDFTKTMVGTDAKPAEVLAIAFESYAQAEAQGLPVPKPTPKAANEKLNAVQTFKAMILDINLNDTENFVSRFFADRKPKARLAKLIAPSLNTPERTNTFNSIFKNVSEQCETRRELRESTVTLETTQAELKDLKAQQEPSYHTPKALNTRMMPPGSRGG